MLSYTKKTTSGVPVPSEIQYPPISPPASKIILEILPTIKHTLVAYAKV